MTGSDNQALDEVVAYARHKLQEQFLSRCESPIESSMALWLLRHAGVWPGLIGQVSTTETVARLGPGVVAPQTCAAVEWTRTSDNARLWLIPQLRVLLGEAEARLDFAMVVSRVDGSIERRIAVECDGHDFHERTKDQAARDKRRDRGLQASGWVVLRFTGSEIFQRASWCAKECFDLVMGNEEASA